MPRPIVVPAPFLFLLVAAALLVAPGCGDRRSPAARQGPVVVVRSSPDRTFEAHSATVEAAAPDASSRGEVRFVGTGARLAVVGRGSGKSYPELEEPMAVVDLVRGATDVVSYGGAAVRGTSTFRYQVVIDADQAVTATPPARQAVLRSFVARLGGSHFYADVWVDGQGRIRRIQLPVQKTTRRPVRRETPQLVTVDIFDFRP